MTNAEKYQEALKKTIKAGSLAVNKITGRPFACEATGTCADCLFNAAADCNAVAIEWLIKDFKEKKCKYKLTPFEKELIERLKSKWSHISRDNGLYIVLSQSEKPTFYLEKYAFKLDRVIDQAGLFGFIGEGEKLKITDILDDCEVIEDEVND